MAERTSPDLNTLDSQNTSGFVAEAPEEDEETEEEEAKSDGEILSDSDDEELPPENPCRDIRGGLETVLNSEFKFQGSFSFSKTCDGAHNPGIQIAGLGGVGLPLTDRDAKLVAAHSIQAPFGQGERTVVDTTVRDTWEIDASKVTLANPSWDSFMETSVAEIYRTLGLNAATSHPKCELYKLLLYETGSHFLPHVDTEKADGMFATVIVVLPSEFTGGAAHLSHCGVSKVYDSSSTSRFQTTVLAWYTDVTHEIKPVTGGYRLALAYNLIHTNTASRRPVLPKSDQHITKLRHILASWKHSLNPSPKKIHYLLDHTYAQAGLRGSALKGGDAQRLALLETLAAELGFQLGLASVECTQSGPADDDGAHYYDRRRGWGYDSDEGANDGSVDFMEVDDHEMKITNLVSLEGEVLRGEVECDDDLKFECIPAHLQDMVEDGPHDGQQYEGYMGNGAGSLSRWYRRTVLVIWPNFNDSEVGAGRQENPLDVLRLTISKKPTRSERRLTQQLLSRGTGRDDNSLEDVAASICGAACQWANISLWRKAIKRFGLQVVIHSLAPSEFVEALNAFGFSELKPILEEVLKNYPLNTTRFLIIDGLRDNLKAEGNPQSDSAFPAWLQAQKRSVISSLRQPFSGEVQLLLNLAKEEGGVSFIEEVYAPSDMTRLNNRIEVFSRLLPQLLDKSDSDFLVAFATALHSCRTDSSMVGDGDGSRVSSLSRLVTTILATAITKANFFAEMKKPAANRWGIPLTDADLAASGEKSAQQVLTFMAACLSTDNRQLLDPVLLKLVDVTGLPSNIVSTYMRFAIFKVLDLLKQSDTDNLHGPAFHAIFVQLRQQSIFIYLSTMSAWPTEKDIEILVDFLVAEKDPESSLQRIIAKLKSLPLQSDRCQQFASLLHKRIADSSSAKARTAMGLATTDLVQLVVAKVNLKGEDHNGYSYGRPAPTFQKIVTNLMQFCRETGNMTCCSDLLKRCLSTFSSAQQTQSFLVPLIPELRHWAISQKLPLTSDPTASTLRCIMDRFVAKILGPKPSGAEALLASVHKMPCTCSPCISAKNFLLNSAERSLRLDRIGAPKRKHVEQYLSAYCKTACSWATITGSPQGLKITKLPAVLKPAQWNADRAKGVAVLKSISTDVKELEDIFGREGFVKLADTVGWPAVTATDTATSSASSAVPQPIVPHGAPNPAKTALKKRKATDITSVIDLCSP